MSIGRRSFIQKLTTALIPLLAAGEKYPMTSKSGWGYRYIRGEVFGGNNPLPKDVNLPFDWPYFTLEPEKKVQILWPERGMPMCRKALIRINCATDFRDEIIIEARSSQSGEKLGVFDIRYPHYMQPFEMELLWEEVEVILKEGMTLQMIKGKSPIWFFNNGEKIPNAFSPHLLLYDNQHRDKDAWIKRLLSLESIQRFGWMEGVALDGIYAALDFHPDKGRVLAVVHEHINMYFKNDQLSYLGIRNRLCDISNIGGEDSLPFAIIAKVWPDCPALEGIIGYFSRLAEDRGITVGEKVKKGSWLSTEGCYTQAYPAASIAKELNNMEMANFSIASLLTRRDQLTDDRNIYQKAKVDEDKYYRNWVRGVAWYLLGLERSLECLPEHLKHLDELKIEFNRATEVVLRYQNINGLWSSIMDESDTGTDTSGSAGVAAAIALGVKNGFLDQKLLSYAKKTCVTLNNDFMTPDGFMKGSCQENKGGLALQTSGYRAISPYTLGFLAMLKAGLS